MTPEDFNPDYLVPGTRIGAYVVRGLLGQGGSSSVYEVESAEGHRFALKICRYHGGAAYGTSKWRVDQRYSRSIICLQLLKDRRNVAELYAHDRHPDPLHGHQYLVQELVPDGLFITDWVKRESPPLQKLVGAFAELAELCGVMASMGICHRDLKPPNILVTPEGTPKVIDFESATCPHVEPVTRRAASEVPGTGGWQCPELCKAILEEQSKKKRKKAFDFLPWGDLFSLGVVFYECLTGEHPFDTSLPDELLLAEVAFEKPIHPVRLSHAVPLGLNKVVMKMLEKQPKARYRDGAEVADDLRRLLKKVKDKRWAKPFKQPVADEEEAPVLPLVSVLVPPETPVPANEKESEAPMPDTPHSGPHSVDTGAPAEAKTPRDAPSSPLPAKPGSSPPHLADTAEPRGVPESVLLRTLDAEGDVDMPKVLDFGEAGTYKLETCLGRGGMGEVYRARQMGAEGFVQSVAIKRLRPWCKSAEARSFVDEAHILSRLHHPNIARVYGFYKWKGSHYLVMEYVEGRSLHSLLELARQKGQRFSESVACAVMAEVADALNHAHHVTDEEGRPLNIVHRDVSPTNILITKTGRVVLVDFGVAFTTKEGRVVTLPGSIIKGKAPYVSPEQVKHLPLDARSDLFSVGTILVEMLTGKTPFGWTAGWKTLNRIATVTPEFVASLLPGVSRPLLALCQKLLAAHREQRFDTAGEVATALRQYAGLGAGAQGIQAEVERLQALPDAKAPLPAAEAAARALSGVKRARRAVAFAGAAMVAALVFASWYVPHHAAVPVPSSPPVQGPAVASARSPERTIAQAPPVSPPTVLAGKPKSGDGSTVAAGPARRRSVVAADEAQQGKKDSQRGGTTHGAEHRGGNVAGETGRLAAASTPPSTASTNATADTPSLGGNGEPPVAALTEQPRPSPRTLFAAYGEATSPDHALAVLLASNRADLTSYFPIRKRKLQVRGLSAEVQIFLPWKAGDGSKVAVVVELTNPNDAPAWELNEAQIEPAPAERAEPIVAITPAMVVKPAAVWALPRVLPPGQKGRVALVFDRASAGLDKVDGTARLLELLRNDRVELAVELSPGDVQDSRSALERWWSR